MDCIENERICLKVSAQGAEMHSLVDKADGREYLWQGDTKYWKWHAPVCFPIVGVVHDGTATRAGEPIRLTVHGFARDRSFRKLSQSENELLYELRSDDDTLARYPYRFAFRIGYRIQGNQITTRYEVENTDKKNMYFSLGAHTAYRCPVTPQGEFSGMELRFPTEKPLKHFLFDGEFITERQAELPVEKGVLPLKQALFSKGVLAFKHPGIIEVELVQKEIGKGVQVDFKGFPYLGVWTKAEGAPFVCIEPWHGVTDGEARTAFEEKEGLCELAEGKRFSASYTITIK